MVDRNFKIVTKNDSSWETRYREGNYPTRPAAWLEAQRDLLKAQPRGRALDVACGAGRHAIYLARLGFEVEAVDRSETALALLADTAQREKLNIHPSRIDLEHEELPVGPYQVILVFYYLERRLFSALKKALAPGGLLIYETYTRDHAEVLGRRMRPEFLLEPGELRRAFKDLEILEWREGVHDEKAVTGLVARA